MRVSILLFVLGAWLLQQQSRLPDLNLAWFALPVLGSALYFRNSRAPVADSLWKLLALCAGFLWAALIAQSRLGSALDLELEGRDLLVTGVVASLPQVNERGIRFEFDVEANPRVPNHVSLSWYHQRLNDGAIEFAPQVRAGERWQLTVRLRRPHGNANPHGFDYEAWLLERNIRATGYVRQSPDNRLAAPEAPGFTYRIERWRENLRERFRRALPEHPVAGVLVALAIGDQHAISPDQWQVFTRTGVNHLMSISGLHVTMVASLAFALVYGSWRRFPRLALWLPARSAASLAAALMALAYAALAGFAVPAQRTVYMVFAVALTLWLKRAISPSRVLCLALLAVVLIDPWAVLAPGFWLSFGAVAIILYVTAGRLGLSVGGKDLDRTSRFRRNLRLSFLWGRVQWSLTLGLIPLTLALFQQVSLVSPIANAVAIPVVSLVVVPLTLLAAIPALEFLLYPAHAIMLWCFEFLEWLSQLPDAVWQQHAPPVWAIAAGLAGAA